jgi:hypothetical protein
LYDRCTLKRSCKAAAKTPVQRTVLTVPSTGAKCPGGGLARGLAGRLRPTLAQGQEFAVAILSLGPHMGVKAINLQNLFRALSVIDG